MRSCRRACCSTGRPEPERRCSHARQRTSQVRSSMRRAPLRSSRCSPGSGQLAFASSSTRRGSTRPRSSSSTSSTPSAPLVAGHSFNREQDQTLNQLLVELDGFSSGAQVVVMGASNRLQDLDPALLRPGRFDRQLLVAPPDRKGREAILQVHTRRKPLSSDVQLELIARQTSGLTGADLANIANEAAILAGRRSAKYVSARSTSTTRSSGWSPACSRRRS